GAQAQCAQASAPEQDRRRQREAAGFSEACRGNNVRQETGRCYPALQPDRIAFDITPRPWVIIAEIIVTRFCAPVEELPGKRSSSPKAPVGSPLPKGSWFHGHTAAPLASVI
ncbi:MAG: hypothetical protein CR217_14850, partial [Beijerinckiaceae bacterium]